MLPLFKPNYSRRLVFSVHIDGLQYAWNALLQANRPTWVTSQCKFNYSIL